MITAEYATTVRVTGTVFANSSVTGFPVPDLPKTGAVLEALERADILGGLPVDGGILWCATEKVSKAALDQTIAIVKEVLAP